MTINELNEHFIVETSFYETEYKLITTRHVDVKIKHKTLPFSIDRKSEWCSKIYIFNNKANPATFAMRLYNSMLKKLSNIKEKGKAHCLVNETGKHYAIEWDNTRQCFFTLTENGIKQY